MRQRCSELVLLVALTLHKQNNVLNISQRTSSTQAEQLGYSHYPVPLGDLHVSFSLLPVAATKVIQNGPAALMPKKSANINVRQPAPHLYTSLKSHDKDQMQAPASSSVEASFILVGVLSDS